MYIQKYAKDIKCKIYNIYNIFIIIVLYIIYYIMNKIDFIAALILLSSAFLYIYILVKNNTFVNKNKNKRIPSILNKKQSLFFEIIELLLIFIVAIFLYKQKQFILFIVFTFAFLEHINQIIFCYRQDLTSSKLITILIYSVFMVYAYFKKCYWIIPLFIIGIFIHSLSVYYNKAFSGIVCITN